MIDYDALASLLHEAFTPACQLPIAVSFTEQPLGGNPLPGHCMFASLEAIRSGQIVSFTTSTLHCGGGKCYCGFAPMPANVPQFVSQRERYKLTPHMVSDYVASLSILPAPGTYLNFARIDHHPAHVPAEGIFFVARPDIIAGLCAWAYYDNNSPTAVQAPFGSGCATTITFMVNENHRHGDSCFLGMFDISARQWVAPDELTFAIPASRLATMLTTLRQSCLFDAPAWQKIKSRL